ncbi:MAG: SecDF P1 head subdomain-containing protein [Streptosporangiales bacterium]
MRGQRPVFAFGGIIVVFAAVVLGVFGLVTLFEKSQGAHIPSGWAWVKYQTHGAVSAKERESLAKSVVFRLHMGRAADTRWWVEDDGFIIAVPPGERTELRAVPQEGAELEFGGVSESGAVGKGKIVSESGCRKPPDGYACSRDQNTWYDLKDPILTGDNVAATRVVEDKGGVGGFIIVMRFDEAGTAKLATASKAMAAATGDDQRLAVAYGEVVLDAPKVDKPNTSGVVRLPGFSKPEGRDLADAVQASKLDVTLEKGPVQIEG